MIVTLSAATMKAEPTRTAMAFMCTVIRRPYVSVILFATRLERRPPMVNIEVIYTVKELRISLFVKLRCDHWLPDTKIVSELLMDVK